MSQESISALSACDYTNSYLGEAELSLDGSQVLREGGR